MALPARFAKHIALHGSIAVNGVSLTVARKSGSVITVALIRTRCATPILAPSPWAMS